MALNTAQKEAKRKTYIEPQTEKRKNMTLERVTKRNNKGLLNWTSLPAIGSITSDAKTCINICSARNS